MWWCRVVIFNGVDTAAGIEAYLGLQPALEALRQQIEPQRQEVQLQRMLPLDHPAVVDEARPRQPRPVEGYRALYVRDCRWPGLVHDVVQPELSGDRSETRKRVQKMYRRAGGRKRRWV